MNARHMVLLAAAAAATFAAAVWLRVAPALGEPADGTAPTLVASAPPAWSEGLRRLEAGDATAALAQLAAAERDLGVAPQALLRARLHAAFAAGDGVDGEFTAEKLVMRGGPVALRDFATGLAELARARRVGLEARQPGAPPTAWDRAVRHATAALVAFQAASLAANTRGDWPIARRNAERAAVLRTELQRLGDQAKNDKKKEQDRQQRPDADDHQELEQQLQIPEAGRLTAAELQALRERLAQAEEEKRGIRRAVREQRSASVEQDW